MSVGAARGAANARSRRPAWLSGFFALLSLCIMVIGFVPAFLDMAGYPFLPSLAWMAAMGDIATPVGLICALAISWILFATRESNTYFKGVSPNRLFLQLFWTTLMMWACAYNVLLFGWPIARALVSDEDVRLEFVVRRDPGYSDRKCRRSVELEGLPWMADRLCFVPAEVFDAVKRGDRVAVIGHGTSDGVFFDDVERLR